MINLRFIARHIFIACAGLAFFNTLRAQSPKWVLYNKNNSQLPDNQVQAIAISKNNTKWIGTADGLVRLDGNNWTIYTHHNSPLPSSFITAITIDKSGKIWIGTDNGLAVFDGSSWMIYNAQNTPLLTHSINKLVYDEKNNILWIANEKVLIKYDGAAWTRYDESNSYIFDTFVINSLAVDKNGILWVGAFDTFLFNGRLLRFDGNQWSISKLDNHGLYSSFPYSLTVDAQNTLWMGTGGTTGGVLVRIKDYQWDILDQSVSPFIRGGLALVTKNNSLWAASNGIAVYDGTEWSGFTTKNSQLPDDYVYALAVDSKNNIWIGTISGGLAIYQTDAISEEQPTFSLYNFPNPFKQTTTIKYEIPVTGKVQLMIYNAAGQLIETIQNGFKQPGSHIVSWDPGIHPDGVYFCYLYYNNKRSVTKLALQR